MDPAELLPPHFSVAATDRDAVRTVTPRGELDLATAPELVDGLGTLEGVEQLVLDLREVTFLDSSGVRALLKARRAADEAGATFRLVDRPQGPATHALRLTGLDAELPISAPDAR